MLNRLLFFPLLAIYIYKGTPYLHLPYHRCAKQIFNHLLPGSIKSFPPTNNYFVIGNIHSLFLLQLAFRLQNSSSTTHTVQSKTKEKTNPGRNNLLRYRRNQTLQFIVARRQPISFLLCVWWDKLWNSFVAYLNYVWPPQSNNLTLRQEPAFQVLIAGPLIHKGNNCILYCAYSPLSHPHKLLLIAVLIFPLCANLFYWSESINI